MKQLSKVTLVLFFGVLMGGCEYITPSAPPDSILNRGMIEALMDTGFYREVAITRTIGRHYNPSERAWRVFACFQFVLTDQQQGATCVDSFEALQLDNDSWVVAVTIEGVYRWRAIEASGSSQGSPQTGIPSTPD